MREEYELSHNELDLNSIVLDNSSNIEDEENIFVGNSRVREILEFSLENKNQGYNIYISSQEGLNLIEFLKKFLKIKGNKEEIPDDWCYVYNFKNTDKPKAISLPSGKGKKFKKMIESCIEDIILQVKERFSSKEFKKVEGQLKDEFLTKGEEKLEELKDDAKSLDFSTNITEKGIFFIPILNGKKISEEQYDDLTVEEQEVIINNLNVIESKSQDIMEQVKKLKKMSESKVIKFENRIIKNLIEESFAEVENEFNSRKKLSVYIKELKEDLLKTIKDCILEEESKDRLKSLLLADSKDDSLTKYEINLFVDNSNLKGSPIIYSKNFSYYEMFGKIEYENDQGVYTTDYSLIREGILHNANGGYLIINAENILRSSLIWETFKKMLFAKKIEYENIREQLGALPIQTIKPEPIPLDLKVIMIGSENLYRLLYSLDSEFKELFKDYVQMSISVDKNKKITDQYCSNFDFICSKYGYRALTNDGKNELLKISSRIANDRNKLTTKFEILSDLISEADICAKHLESSVINRKVIKKTIEQRNKRIWLMKEQIKDMYQKKKLLFDSGGFKVGQINGIAVSDYGDYTIARVIRITAVTYMGKLGVINIEKENKLSGSIFDKGIGILSGYIGNHYSQDFPMMLNCQLCFEQVYNTIDGDSASCAELYAILSSISEVPIDQSLCITGSVDQFGNVQPVGSISDKIQGCFEAFKAKGLTGKQGIIVPIQNVDEIILEDEILEAIKNGLFHIYSIKSIEQGIEILTNKKMPEIDVKIKNKLKNYHEKGKDNIKEATPLEV